MNVLLISQSIVNAGVGGGGWGGCIPIPWLAQGRFRLYRHPVWPRAALLGAGADEHNSIAVPDRQTEKKNAVTAPSYLIWVLFDYNCWIFEQDFVLMCSALISLNYSGQYYTTSERRLPTPRRVLSEQGKRQSTRQICNRAHGG